MQKVQSGQDLQQKRFDFRGQEGLAHFVEEGFQIMFEKVHNEEDTAHSGNQTGRHIINECDAPEQVNFFCIASRTFQGSRGYQAKAKGVCQLTRPFCFQ